MNICRQCFREKSTDIGFNKVRFLTFRYTDSRTPGTSTIFMAALGPVSFYRTDALTIPAQYR
jgi:hypothetical protein